MGDIAAYCASRTGSPMARPPNSSGGSWSCGRRGHSQDFTPTDVCRAVSGDHTATATAGDIRDPRTWRCYT
jgi:hypothetical protein